MFSHILAFGLGAGAMYWGSDKVKTNVHQTAQDLEQIATSKELIKQYAIDYITEVYQSGKLPEFMAELNRQTAQASYPAYPNVLVPNLNLMPNQ